MVTIKKLTIENFQSHENTSLDFSKGLNIIIGPSDQGKSSVIRAIKWVLFNEPRGYDFIRQGASTARVTIEFNNGSRITRERSKSRNKYSVTYPDGSNMDFEGFGNEIPEEVVKAHGIPKVILDKDIRTVLNVSDQLEGPFMLSESGAIRAKAIGRLTGTHIIDNAIRDCLVDLRRENQTRERTERELKALDLKLEEYKRLDEIEESLGIIDRTVKKLEGHIYKKDNLGRIRITLEKFETEIRETVHNVKKLANLKESEIYVKDCEIRLGRINTVERIGSNLGEVEKNMGQAMAVVRETLNIKKCDDIVAKLEVKIEKHEKLCTAVSQLKDISVKIGMLELKVEKTNNLDSLGNVIKSIGNSLLKKEKLEQLSARCNSMQKEYKSLHNALNRLKTIEILDNTIKSATKKQGDLKEFVRLREVYRQVSKHIEEGNNYIEKNQEDLKCFSAQYKELLRALGKCPLCESSINENKLEDILKHYEGEHR